MKALFADSFYYLAILNADDAAHQLAVDFSEKQRGPVATTVWVLTEVADPLSAPGQRGGFVRFLDALRGDAEVTIIPPGPELFEAGLSLYSQRPDKDWTLTDCISFVVMERMDLREALTGDHHFEQAGFAALLK